MLQFRPILAAALGVLASLSIASLPTFAAGEAATAEMKLASGAVAGTVTFVEGTAGVLLKFDLKGLPPGAHAVSVHDVGTCDGDFASAGEIYNPLGAKHGFINDEGPMAGDLTNIYAGADGTVISEALSPFLTLSSDAEETLFDADGASLVIGEKPDDYASEPDGASGRRIACGVIKASK
jgi:Cu-Zn family superoxide dismutase